MFSNIYFFVLFGIIAGLCINELMRRYSFIAWALCSIVPILLTPFWIRSNSDLDWFFWIKIYLIFFMTFIGVAIKETSIGKYGLFGFIIYLFISANIIECGVKSFFSGLFVGYVNGVNSLLLVSVTPTPPGAIRIGYHPTFRDFKYNTPYEWIFSYTVTNAVFVYIFYTELIIHEIMSLFVPLIVSLLIDRDLWGQTRAFTLTFFFIMTFTFPCFRNACIYKGVANEAVSLVLSLLMLIFLAVYFIRERVLEKETEG